MNVKLSHWAITCAGLLATPLSAQEPTEKAILTGHRDGVWAVAFNPNGKLLASASLDGTIKLWDVKTGKDKATPRVFPVDYVASVAFSPDGRLLASAGLNGTIRLWSITATKKADQ